VGVDLADGFERLARRRAAGDLGLSTARDCFDRGGVDGAGVQDERDDEVDGLWASVYDDGLEMAFLGDEVNEPLARLEKSRGLTFSKSSKMGSSAALRLGEGVERAVRS
jgi:hypothetical protein